MGVFGGPDIVTDGLTFSLDPVSQKNYSIDELFVEYLIAGGGGAAVDGEMVLVAVLVEYY